MRCVRHTRHLINSVHCGAGSEIDIHTVARHQIMRPGCAGLRIAADGQFRQQATARALNQIRRRNREMIRVNHARQLEQSVRRAAGGEHQINRIADNQAVVGKGGGDDTVRLAVTAGQKLGRIHGQSCLAGRSHAVTLRGRRGFSRSIGENQERRVAVVEQVWLGGGDGDDLAGGLAVSPADGWRCGKRTSERGDAQQRLALFAVSRL